MRIDLQIDSTELVLRLQNGQRRLAYAVVNAINNTGQISTLNGKIDPDQADREWRKNTDQSKPRNRITGRPNQARIPGEPSEPMDFGGAEGGNGTATGYARARAARDVYQAHLAKIELDRQRGTLVSADEVKVGAFNMARKARDQLIALPERVAANLAATQDPAEVQRIPEEEIARICQEEYRGREQLARVRHAPLSGAVSGLAPLVGGSRRVHRGEGEPAAPQELDQDARAERGARPRGLLPGRSLHSRAGVREVATGAGGRPGAEGRDPGTGAGRASGAGRSAVGVDHGVAGVGQALCTVFAHQPVGFGTVRPEGSAKGSGSWCRGRLPCEKEPPRSQPRGDQRSRRTIQR